VDHAAFLGLEKKPPKPGDGERAEMPSHFFTSFDVQTLHKNPTAVYLVHLKLRLCAWL